MKYIVVTGASKGLGLAITEALLAHDYGVIALSRSKTDAVVELEKKFDDRFEWMQVDLQNTDALYSRAGTILHRYPVYGLINNAGYVHDQLVVMNNQEEIDKMIRINFSAPIALSRLFAKHFLIQREGRIIQMGSIAAFRAFKGMAVYAATKAGLSAFSKGLAQEIGSRNITVNNITPGFIPTSINAHVPDHRMDHIRRRTALKRLAAAEDVAEAVLFLLSDKGKNMTGMDWVIDAGQSL